MKVGIKDGKAKRVGGVLGKEHMPRRKTTFAAKAR